MSLSTLLLAVFLGLVGLAWLDWVDVSIKLLGALALATGILVLLEGLSVFSYHVPNRRKA